MRPQSRVEPSKNCSSSIVWIKLRSNSLEEAKAVPAPTSLLPEREFVVDSGASVHMVSKKGFELR